MKKVRYRDNTATTNYKNMKTITLAILTLPLLLSAQSENTSDPKVKISSASISSNVLIRRNRDYVDINQFQKEAGNSGLFNVDLDQYEKSNYHYSFSGSNQVELNMGLSFLNNKTGFYDPSRELIVGISYNSFRSNIAHYSRDAGISALDTFQSSSGDIIYTETSGGERLDYHATSEYLLLNVSYLFKTDRNKRLSMFSGIGTEIGHSISRTYDASYYNRDLISYKKSNGESISSEVISYDQDFEAASVESSTLARLYVPIGINLRLSKKWAILESMSIFLQAKLGVQYETGSNNLRTLSGYGLGVRYNI